jgi:hypothetical protein
MMRILLINMPYAIKMIFLKRIGLIFVTGIKESTAKREVFSMQLLSGAEHFGNVVNVTLIIVEMLNRCMNKR